MKKKYIRFERNDGMHDIAVFSDDIMHCDMADMLKGDRLPNLFEVISAGDVIIKENGEFCCCGESISLRKRSLPEDTQFLYEKLQMTFNKATKDDQIYMVFDDQKER